MLTIASILRCPVTGSDLSFVGGQQLREVKAKIEEGELRHLTGQPVQTRFEAALSSPDGRFIYPVIDEILVLLPSLCIARRESWSGIPVQQLMSDSESVMRFYDEIGWQPSKDGTGGFQDAKRFEDLRPVSAEYIHRCHMRVNKYIPRRGVYFLDIASGPLQYDEYLSYSAGYDVRICADVSMTALQAARARLADKGVYIQCDITRLPLKDASVDSFVSLHTIYHVRESKQLMAIRELGRVLSPERTGVVVYSWGEHCRAMRVLTAHTPRQLLRRALPVFLVRWVKRISGGRKPATSRGEAPASGEKQEEPGLYFQPHDFRWFRQEVAAEPGWSIKVWRSVSVPFLQRHVHPRRLGRLLLALLFRFENVFPYFTGRFGQYPLLVYRKARPATAWDSGSRVYELEPSNT